MKLNINGQPYERDVNEHTTLLHFLRHDLGLTGTKEGCGSGECGACTIIMDGKSVNSCLVLAAEADGSELETIEGVAVSGELSAIQQAFHENHAVQCGFCTPGMVMSATDLLRRNPQPTRDEIIDGIEGNFCRCTGYEQIIEAVDAAARGEVSGRDGSASIERGSDTPAATLEPRPGVNEEADHA
ncbi:MAG TPA: (2Fe-2S)-binding protein [Spirochaetia bacterium]|nr:(2Fe-2S)-binding protein [Spirochaetia bacterium]